MLTLMREPIPRFALTTPSSIPGFP
jgi:hypothetical protein